MLKESSFQDGSKLLEMVLINSTFQVIEVLFFMLTQHQKSKLEVIKLPILVIKLLSEIIMITEIQIITHKFQVKLHYKKENSIGLKFITQMLVQMVIFQFQLNSHHMIHHQMLSMLYHKLTESEQNKETIKQKLLKLLLQVSKLMKIHSNLNSLIDQQEVLLLGQMNQMNSIGNQVIFVQLSMLLVIMIVDQQEKMLEVMVLNGQLKFIFGDQKTEVWCQQFQVKEFKHKLHNYYHIHHHSLVLGIFSIKENQLNIGNQENGTLSSHTTFKVGKLEMV